MSGSQWEKFFDSFEPLPLEQTWCSPPKLHEPMQKPPEEEIKNIAASSMAKWLIVNVLGDPSKLNTFFEARMTRDLLYRTTTGSTGGMYFNESSAAFDGMNTRNHFDFNLAYDQMLFQCQKKNNWEQRRIETMKERGLIK